MAAVVLASTIHAQPQVHDGKHSIVELPLEKSVKFSSRFEEMQIEYWTSLRETKECIRDPLECNLDRYD